MIDEQTGISEIVGLNQHDVFALVPVQAKAKLRLIENVVASGGNDRSRRDNVAVQVAQPVTQPITTDVDIGTRRIEKLNRIDNRWIRVGQDFVNHHTLGCRHTGHPWSTSMFETRPPSRRGIRIKRYAQHQRWVDDFQRTTIAIRPRRPVATVIIGKRKERNSRR